MRILTVMGQGEQSVESTIAQVNLGVEVEADTAEAAQREAAQQSNAVVNLLRDRQVERLQTTGIRLNPRYNNSEGQRQLVGYIATNTVSFEMPVDAVGALLDETVNAGATRIQGISFRAEEGAIAAAREVALTRAVANAQSQASAVLGALNFSAEEIVGIQVNHAMPPTPPPFLQSAQLADAVPANTPVIGGEQTVTATVTLQIRY